MKLKQFIICLTAFFLLAGCSKDGNNDPSSPGNGGTTFPAGYSKGKLFMKQGTEGITKFDLSSGGISNVMPHWIGVGWDISWDGSKGVKQTKPSGYDTRFIIFNTQNGSTIKEVRYESNDGDAGLPYFSPDGTKLALRPMFDDGLVILDMNGNVLRNISGYGTTHSFEYLDPICWESGGTVLFKKDGGLWRTSSDFSRATKVRDIPFSDWKGVAAASPDGKKIAIPAGNHIWLMNADGSDFHAITSSDQRELAPCFSPDSKYLAMKANARAPMAGDIGYNTFHVCIIPADGQVYKLWPGEDNRVIHPMIKGKPDSRGLGIAMVGDFVWR